MRTLTQNKVQDQINAIMLLDLTMIRKKLMEPKPEGQGWTPEQALEAEKWYRRYLVLIAKYPRLRAVPNLPIDLYWHQHILDTRKYAQDCQTIFGEFIHHYPYFGLNGDRDERDASFDETCAMYHQEFGEDCRQMASFAIDGPTSCNDTPYSAEVGPKAQHDTKCAQGCGVEANKCARVAVGVSCGGGGSGTGCSQK